MVPVETVIMFPWCFRICFFRVGDPISNAQHRRAIDGPAERRHATGRWDGQYLSIYINGKLENKPDINLGIDNFGSDIFIGSYGGRIAEYAFNGAIDELYIHNRVLEEHEIKAFSEVGYEE